MTQALRRFLVALVLGLAVAAGQHAAQLHDLGHALKRVQSGSQQDQHPGSDTCDKCSLYAPFAGAASAYVATIPLVAATIVAAPFSFLPAPSRTVVSARSRAPPTAA
jgi:hypothetical protein